MSIFNNSHLMAFFQDNLGKLAPDRFNKQEMMQWHQLEQMHVICTSLQTDNCSRTSSLNFLHASSLADTHPTVSKH